jgi:DnaJ-class molecular chaperone
MFSNNELSQIYRMSKQCDNLEISIKTANLISRRGYILCRECDGVGKKYNALQDQMDDCEACDGDGVAKKTMG